MFKFFRNLAHKAETVLGQYPVLMHAVIAIGSIALIPVTLGIAGARYEDSLYPVPFYVGQTAFRGELLKEYYGFMLDQGTFHIYWQTQFLDFFFISALFLTGLTVPTLIGRAFKADSWWRGVSRFAVMATTFAAACDAMENLVSFTMLVQPLTFPNWIAPIYSSIAAVKFGLMFMGIPIMSLLVIAAVITVARTQFGQSNA